jgi:hypothetical protein
MVVAFAFLIQAFSLSKNDCLSQVAAADAARQAIEFGWALLFCGLLALIAAWLPAVVGSVRNYWRRRADPQPPPLEPKHEFDGLSEQAVDLVVLVQRFLVVISCSLFRVMLNDAKSAPCDVYERQAPRSGRHHPR